MYCTVVIWREGWDLVHGVHILFACLMYVLYSGYLEKRLGSCTWCTYIVYLFNICTVQWLSGERVGILYMLYRWLLSVFCIVSIIQETLKLN